MSRWAVIRSDDNVVDNIIEWDGVAPWAPPADHYAVAMGSADVDIGYVYDPATGTFSPPPPEP